MGPIGRKIFGMSKENYVQKYGAKVYRYKVSFLSFLKLDTVKKQFF